MPITYKFFVLCFRFPAILSIYIKNKLHFSEDTATVIYHTFSGLCYFTPIFGAMLADQLLGKFKSAQETDKQTPRAGLPGLRKLEWPITKP